MQYDNQWHRFVKVSVFELLVQKPWEYLFAQACYPQVLMKIHKLSMQSQLHEYPKNQQVHQTFSLQSLLVLLEIIAGTSSKIDPCVIALNEILPTLGFKFETDILNPILNVQ